MKTATTVHGFLALLLTLGIGAVSAQAQLGSGWVHLGSARVDGSADHDNIKVSDSKGGIRALQLRVQGGSIHFARVIVHYEDAPDQRLNVSQAIPPGGSTRVIDLPGGQRNINSVEIWYAKGNWGSQKPTVELYGRR